MRLNKVLFILLSFISLILVFLLVLSQNKLDNKEQIALGELGYSCNCGWISWDHAIPDGVQRIIQKIVQDTAVSISNKEVTYTQSMKINFIGKSKIVAEVSRKYVLGKGLTKKKREDIAFTVFQKTSESFERMQGSFPFLLNYGSQSSSFKEGDLMGDLIAFYRALRGYTKKDIVKICMAKSIMESLIQFKKCKYGKNINWKPAPKGVFPQALNEFSYDKEFSEKELLFLKEMRKIYLEF